jgi:LacI family repressor for deo operon, udp, cdd, tsx, nupC, and nupG
MAMGVLQVAREKRLRVPKDLSVVGFDDIRFAQYTQPSLTTISQPMRAIGEGTVRLLLSIIEDPSVTPESVTLPHSLVARESTGAPARL